MRNSLLLLLVLFLSIKQAKSSNRILHHDSIAVKDSSKTVPQGFGIRYQTLTLNPTYLISAYVFLCFKNSQLEIIISKNGEINHSFEKLNGVAIDWKRFLKPDGSIFRSYFCVKMDVLYAYKHALLISTIGIGAKININKHLNFDNGFTYGYTNGKYTNDNTVSTIHFGIDYTF